MYASRVTPVQRMRGSDSPRSSSSVGRRHSSNSATVATACMSPTKASAVSRSSALSGLDAVPSSFRSRRNRNGVGARLHTSANKGGDYQVLRSNVEQERTRVHEARVDLASKLDEMGEHHVRRKEYDSAMDAFTEALREKRSVFWNIGNCDVRNLPQCNNGSSSPRKSKGNQNNDPNSDQASSFSSSLLSGISNGNCNVPGSTMYDASNGEGNDDDNDASYRDHVRVHDATIDALVHTLRNIGNVHSLRGEQDEAMRYFTEVTTLRAQKLSSEYESACQDADDASVETRSFLSGLGGGNSAFSAGTINTETNLISKTGAVTAVSTAITPATATATATVPATTPATATANPTITTGGDENSALMSEINEDVRALDDLFRSISFRQGATNSGATGTPKSSVSAAEKRKSKSSSRRNKKHKRGRMAGSDHLSVDTSSNDLFHRDSPDPNSSQGRAPTTPSNTHSSPTSPTSSNNAKNGKSGEDLFFSAFALGPPDSSASTLAMEKYRGAMDYYVHEDHSKARQHQEKMNSFALRIDLQLTNSKNSESMDASETKADLKLALDIYKHVLQAYREISVSSSGRNNNDIQLQTTVPLSTSSCSSSQKQQSMLSICSSESSSSLSLSSSTSSMSFRKKSRRERRQELAAHIASILICTGSVYYRLGNRNEELEAYKKAKNVYCKAFGENHVFVAGTRKNIGMVLAERGQYDLAQYQFEKAMSIYIHQNKARPQRREDADDVSEGLRKNELQNANMNRDVASVISCIGNVKNRIGELDTALTKYLQALQIYKSLYEIKNGDTSVGKKRSSDAEALRDVTSTLKVIGMVHAKRGDLDTAMQFFQESMDLLRSHENETAAKSDPDDETTTIATNDTTSDANRLAIRETKASVLTRIASIYLKKGELDEAMASYREAYDLTVQNRGNTTNHPEIAGILHYIGGIFHKRGEYDEAMACYQESIRIYHSTLGSEHPTVAGTLVMVGSIHYKRRHLDSAMMFYREALRLNRDAYGMHHPDVAPILKSIGTILTKKGEYHEAYDLFRDVLSVKVTVHGTDHPEVASAYKSLGNVHYKLGELGDAERQYRHALSIYRRCKGDEHPDTLSAKTTIEHLRYWMRERDQQQDQRRQQSSPRRPGENGASDERSC